MHLISVKKSQNQIMHERFNKNKTVYQINFCSFQLRVKSTLMKYRSSLPKVICKKVALKNLLNSQEDT